MRHGDSDSGCGMATRTVGAAWSARAQYVRACRLVEIIPNILITGIIGRNCGEGDTYTFKDTDAEI